MCCCIGAYSVNNSVFDIYVMILFGFLGYPLLKCKIEPSPLILAFLLGPMAEEHLRRAMLLSNGDPSVFVTRPLSLAFIVMALGLVVYMLRLHLSMARRHRIKTHSAPK